MSHSTIPVIGRPPGAPLPAAVPVRRERWFAAGGLLSALLASTCCLLPLALGALGVGGAWIGRLAVLAPLQPWLLGASLACIVAGFVLVRRSASRSCAIDAPRVSHRAVLAALWIAAALVVTALALAVL